MSGYRKSSSKVGWGSGVALVVVAVMVLGQMLFTSKEAGMVASSSTVSINPGGVSSSASRKGDYDVLQSCRLVEHRRNDGDSFHIQTQDGQEHEIRLYYVDTPESYRHKHNGERIGHQAKYFKMADDDEAVELGKEAKAFVLGLLRKNGEFSVLTKWEPVFDSGRYFAFVEVEFDGQKRWLHEVLVEKGYARIYTQGAKMPDGTGVKQRKRALERIEEDARVYGAGGWQ
ncbi:thermonuclease family protein [Sulfuriroseicoccus oceanibius]|uniref:Thermonuclease family protein n=1 Tax=Sulfuriroseicoccus oceanibius TaxID=2707525 RepID=A0A6B3L6V1_9BACT|nr:thermonuclease family protein [Sulfuriroseicoccus oceanibius]QQL43790.1 thermonuclease family protein [Sulfuriroseicoccus oceanibius]